jgi:hypothetical protein
MTTLPSLLLPAGLLALAVLILNLPWVPEASLEAFLRVFPRVVLGLGVLLGVRFRRGRVVFALLALALADWALRTYPSAPAPGDAGRFVFATVALLLPANLGWLALARERGTLTWSGLLRLAVILTQFGLAGLLWMLFDRGLTALLEGQIFPTLLVPTTVLPHPALASFAFAFAATAVSWRGGEPTSRAGSSGRSRRPTSRSSRGAGNHRLPCHRGPDHGGRLGRPFAMACDGLTGSPGGALSRP